MDITGIDIAACGTMVGTIITSVVAVLKANKTESIAKQQKIAQEEELADLRERLAMMEKQGPVFEKLLDDSSRDFERIDTKLDKTNDLLHTLIGIVQGGKGLHAGAEGGLGL